MYAPLHFDSLVTFIDLIFYQSSIDFLETGSVSSTTSGDSSFLATSSTSNPPLASESQHFVPEHQTKSFAPEEQSTNPSMYYTPLPSTFLTGWNSSRETDSTSLDPSYSEWFEPWAQIEPNTGFNSTSFASLAPTNDLNLQFPQISRLHSQLNINSLYRYPHSQHQSCQGPSFTAIASTAPSVLSALYPPDSSTSYYPTWSTSKTSIISSRPTVSF